MPPSPLDPYFYNTRYFIIIDRIQKEDLATGREIIQAAKQARDVARQIFHGNNNPDSGSMRDYYVEKMLWQKYCK